MTVHVLTPVHNRCVVTESFISDLFDQDIDEGLRIVIIDDGSKDGTGEMLRARAQEAPPHATLSVINGDGSWWWARSMATAISACRPHIGEDDVVVFMNDDISVPSGTLTELARSCRERSAVISASVRDVDNPTTLLDRGALLHPMTLTVEPLPLDYSLGNFASLAVASGRTTVYPAKVFMKGVNIDYRRLPHHLADLEFSIRASELGFPILLAEDIHVLSENNFTSQQSPASLWRRLTHVSSPDRLLSYWAFWRSVLPEIPRSLLAWRLIRYRLLPNLVLLFPGVRRLIERRIAKKKAHEGAT